MIDYHTSKLGNDVDSACKTYISGGEETQVISNITRGKGIHVATETTDSIEGNSWKDVIRGCVNVPVFYNCYTPYTSKMESPSRSCATEVQDDPILSYDEERVETERTCVTKVQGDLILNHDEEREAPPDSKALHTTEKNQFKFLNHPTKLFSLLKEKEWEKAIIRCVDYPKEASMIENRWKISPLTFAVVMQAPVNVIEALLYAHPNAIRTYDDKKMLPLHFAFRLGCNEVVANVLVQSYPEALTMKDCKGHTPRSILKAYHHHYKDEEMKGKNSNECMTKNVKGNTIKREVDRNRKCLIEIYLYTKK